MPRFAVILLAALAGCCSSRPAKTWPTRVEWDRLDPLFCHPYPCRGGDPCVEWPGTIDNVAPDVPQVSPPFLTAPPYPPSYMGAPLRGVGVDGYPIYRACGAGRCG